MNRDDILVIVVISVALMVLNQVHALGVLR
jgi:hypothetical protein